MKWTRFNQIMRKKLNFMSWKPRSNVCTSTSKWWLKLKLMMWQSIILLQSCRFYFVIFFYSLLSHFHQQLEINEDDENRRRRRRRRQSRELWDAYCRDFFLARSFKCIIHSWKKNHLDLVVGVIWQFPLFLFSSGE